MKCKLPNVTLLGIDCVNVERLQAAMDLCQESFEFAAVKLMTSLPTDDKRLVTIPHLGTIERYSEFCIRELHEYVETEYVLLVQHDGFILNPAAWEDEFLAYDYIGAPWLVGNWSVERFDFPRESIGTRIVGNGGFCIRSKKFLEVSSKLAKEGKIPKYQPEDVALCVWQRDLMEKEGIIFAPVEVAKRFSYEAEDDDNYSWDGQFGFHGFGWTNIDKWIEKHPEQAVIIDGYKKAQRPSLPI